MYAMFKLLLETCDRVSYLVYLALVVFVGIPDDLDHEAKSVGGTCGSPQVGQIRRSTLSLRAAG